MERTRPGRVGNLRSSKNILCIFACLLVSFFHIPSEEQPLVNFLPPANGTTGQGRNRLTITEPQVKEKKRGERRRIQKKEEEGKEGRGKEEREWERRKGKRTEERKERGEKGKGQGEFEQKYHHAHIISQKPCFINPRVKCDTSIGVAGQKVPRAPKRACG